MLVVEQNYVDLMPQSTVPGWAPPGVDWHWSAGGPGRAGWQGTIVHLVNTRYTINASYHGGMWCEHADGHQGCRTIIQWIVLTTKAAHSVNPPSCWQYNPNKDTAIQTSRFNEVRRVLGVRALDPNAGQIAIAYAGMPADLEADLTCPVFRADVQELARQLVAHPAVIDRPHFGHGWIQPISRYEMDVTTDFIELLYAVPETDVPFIEKYEEWTAAAGTPFWTDGPAVGPQKVWNGGPLVTVAQSVDNNWRIARYQDSSTAPRELLYFRRKPGLTPKVPGGDLLYDAAVVAAIERRTLTPDCSAARLEGFNDAKAKAAAAVGGVTP